MNQTTYSSNGALQLLRDAQETLRSAVQHNIKYHSEDAGMDYMDGENRITTKYQGSEGRGTIRVFYDVFCDGKPIATLVERYPWSIFESLSERVYVDGLYTEEACEAAVLGLEACVEESGYCQEGEPQRFYVAAASLGDALTAWRRLTNETV